MITEAILRLRPDAQFSVNGDTYDGLIWHDEKQTCPSLEEVNIAVQEIKDEIVATQYIKQRQKAYPPVGDQLDAIMKWLATETEVSVPSELKSIAMKCMSVKARYPKPGE